MEIILAVIAGIGLSAACGFRVFVPLLITSIGVHTGMLKIGSGFDWLGSDWALICLAVATACEITAYYVPWLDHALDTMATPAAVVAGTVLTMSQMSHIQGLGDGSHQGLNWIISTVLGGGSALIVQLSTVMLRLASTATTGGLANPVVSTAEHALAFILAAVAILIPLMVVAVLALGVAYYIYRRNRKRARAMATMPAGRILVPNFARA